MLIKEDINRIPDPLTLLAHENTLNLGWNASTVIDRLDEKTVNQIA
jgi:hypothetical protein